MARRDSARLLGGLASPLLTSGPAQCRRSKGGPLMFLTNGALHVGTYRHTCICTDARMRTDMYSDMRAGIRAYAHTCIHACCIHVYIHARMREHAYMRMHYLHTYSHACARIYQRLGSGPFVTPTGKSFRFFRAIERSRRGEAAWASERRSCPSS